MLCCCVDSEITQIFTDRLSHPEMHRMYAQIWQKEALSVSTACTKTRNGKTKPPRQVKQNKRKTPKRNETTEMTENMWVNCEKNLAIYNAKTVARVFSWPLEL